MAEPQRPKAGAAHQLGGARFLIVEARFYDAIGANLLAGAQRALANEGATFEVVSVPGALELALAAAIAVDEALRLRRPYCGIVALGCIIRGETYHFEIVANESARALTELAIGLRMPLGNGVLTVENEAQAQVRADPAKGDKGGDAARAAIALHVLKASGGARS